MCKTREPELKFRWTVLKGKFGTQKYRHGLAKARRRKRWRVSIQAHLTATVMNLKKLADAATASADDRTGQNAAANPASCFSEEALYLLSPLLRPALAPVPLPS
ncbi:hypothetical protein KAW64_13335 [bacterium]|nr:hypothetical protein [bacterium]